MKETHLLLEGVRPDEISEIFLVRVMDAADKCGLPTIGISILRRY